MSHCVEKQGFADAVWDLEMRVGAEVREDGIRTYVSEIILAGSSAMSEISICFVCFHTRIARC